MEANENFFKDILKERIISIKNIEDFDQAKSYFRRKLLVTLDIPVELARMANKAEELIKSKKYEEKDYGLLLSASDFNSKYIDIESLEQLENLKNSFQKVNENKDELIILCPKSKAKKIYNMDYHDDYIEVKEETLFSKIKNKVKKIFEKKPVVNDIKVEVIEEVEVSPIIEPSFTPNSKEIWHYYTSFNKDKYYYQKAQEWGTILEYIIDFDKLANLNSKLVNEIIDFSIKKSLELKTFNIEKSDIEKVFSILKTNWKYGFLLESWQEENYNIKTKSKGNY